MKKLWALITLLGAAGVLFTGCPDPAGSGKPPVVNPKVPGEFTIDHYDVTVSLDDGVKLDLDTFNKIKDIFEKVNEDLSDEALAGFNDLIADGLTVRISANGTLTINVDGKTITIPVSSIGAGLGSALASALNDEFYVEPVPGSFMVGNKTVTVSFGTGVEPDVDLLNTIKSAFTGLAALGPGSGLSTEGQVGFDGMIAAGLSVHISETGSLTINVSGKKITIPVSTINANLGALLASAHNDEFYVDPVPGSFTIGTQNVLIMAGAGIAMDWDMFNTIKDTFTVLSLSGTVQDGFDAMIAAGLSVHISETGSLTIDVSGKTITIPVSSIGTGLGAALTTALDDEFYVESKEGIMKRILVPTYGGAIQDTSGNPYGIRFRFIDGIEDENVINQVLAKFEEAWTVGLLSVAAGNVIRGPVYNRVLARGIKMRIENPESGYYDWERVVDYKTLAWHIDYVLNAPVGDLSADLDIAIMKELNEMTP